MPQHDAETTERFVAALATHQNRLKAYIYSLVADHARAADILQETNLVLWRKIDSFDPERPFLAWAFGIARVQVMAHYRNQQRDRMLLDEALVSQLAQESDRLSVLSNDASSALRTCLQKLNTQHRHLIDLRYFQAQTIADVAGSTDRSEGAVKLLLYRIRRSLAQCIEKSMAAGATR